MGIPYTIYAYKKWAWFNKISNYVDYDEAEAFLGPLLLPHPIEATPIHIPPPPPPPPLPPKKTKFAKPEVLTPSVPPLPPKGAKYFQLKGEGMDINRKPLFFQTLALISLKCLSHGIVQNQCKSLQNSLIKSVGPEHIAVLTWLFVNVQNLSLETPAKLVKLGSFDEFTATVMEFTHEMILSGLVTSDHHGILLRDLGLHPGCWPLSIISLTLSLLARVLIYRLQTRPENQDDPLAVNIWKG